MRRALFILVWLACASSFRSLGAVQSRAYGYDLQGREITRLAVDEQDNAQGPVVLFFLATDCPVSNRYVPEIQRLATQFAAKGVTFWLVYPNATETAEGVLRHNAAYGFTGTAYEHHVLLRPQPRLMALALATITPESAILVAQDANAKGDGLKPVYLGRIDDRYIDIGRERPQATRHDLEQAIEAVLNHRPVTPPGGAPVGCGIVTEAALQSGAGKP